ncbi:MAG: HDIG domain-containing metalloprotein [Lachnospiraceae bacterium]
MNENTKVRCRMLGHALLLLAATGGMLYFVNEILLDENKWNRNYLLVSGFFLLSILAYCILQQRRLFQTTAGSLFSVACFVISLLILLLTESYVNFPVWVAGGILAAALIDRNLGMLYLYFFTFQAIYLQGGSVKGLVLHFLAATAVCIVIPKMKSWLSMLYVMVFAGSLIVILSLVMNRLEFHQDMILDALPILGIYMTCIFAAKVFGMWKNTGSHSDGYEYLEQLAEDTQAAEDTKVAENTPSIVITQFDKVLTGQANTTDFSAYCNESAELLLQLKEKSKHAYAHSKLLAKLAGEAAERIQANASLVRAAAYYHEIGKLREGDVAEQTLLIGKEQGFPTEMLDTLEVFVKKETNTIHSKEAVILFLTDKVISMYMFLRKSGTKTPASKIVDNTMTMQMMRGEWNDSGLSITECTILRNYFIEQLEIQDKKQKQ